MKLKNVKMISSLLGLSLLALPAISNAEDLKVSNSSKYNLSFRVNGMCSKDFGIVERYTINVIRDAKLKKACRLSPSACMVDVYKQEDCIGYSIARITLDTSKGATGVISWPSNEQWDIGISIWDVFIKGPWV